MSFTPSYSQIRNLLNENAVFVIPRYQRKYVWAMDEWKNLFEDLLLVVKRNEEAEPPLKHFIGSFIFEKRGTEWDIVDGQQRLATISILLACLSKKIRDYGDIEGSEAFAKYFFYTNEKNEKAPRINNGSEFYKILLGKYYKSISTIKNIRDFINGENINIKKEEHSFRDCVAYFDGAIDEIVDKEEISEKKIEYLAKIRDAILNLDVIQIIANNKNDGYVIFQVLNSRGKPLETFELLKNYIFTYLKMDNGADTANVIWEEIIQNTEIDNVKNSSIDRFLTNYITHRFGKTSKKREFSTIVGNVKKTEVRQLLDDLKLKSKIYKNIAMGTGYSSKINYVLTFLNSNKITQFRPVLLSLISSLLPQNPEKLEKVLLSIKNFISIYTIVIKGKTNALESIIYKYSKEFHENYSDERCKEFLNYLFEMLPKLKDSFLEKFRKLAYSRNATLYPEENVKSKKEIIHVCTEYEIFLSSDDDPTIKKFTLEHIKDDALGGKAHLIGNIIPLSNRDNKACNGKKTSEKISIYKRSSYKSPEKIVEDMEKNFSAIQEYWLDQHIEGRTNELSNLFYNLIWINKFI